MSIHSHSKMGQLCGQKFTHELIQEAHLRGE